jgi:hypothetical protein
VLAQKLTDTAWVAFSGRLGINLLVSAFVPGSTAISGLSFTHDLVYDTPAADLIVLNRQKMVAMGASDAGAQALLANRWFSLSVLTSLITGGVAGRPYVLALAATATKEEEARFLAAAVHVLARLHVGGVPIRRLITRGTVVGITPDGAVVVPAPVDYLSWTQRAGAFASRADLRAARRGLWLTGRMSGAAQQGFAARGWTVHDVTLSAGSR